MKNFIIGRIENIKGILKTAEKDEIGMKFFESKLKTFEGMLKGIENPLFALSVECAAELTSQKLKIEMNDPTYLEGKLDAYAEVLAYMKV